MLLERGDVVSRNYLTSKNGINAHRLTDVIDLIKKAKLEEKKEKIHNKQSNFIKVITFYTCPIDH